LGESTPSRKRRAVIIGGSMSGLFAAAYLRLRRALQEDVRQGAGSYGPYFENGNWLPIKRH
jgi:thioredoxin reductase